MQEDIHGIGGYNLRWNEAFGTRLGERLSADLRQYLTSAAHTSGKHQHQYRFVRQTENNGSTRWDSNQIHAKVSESFLDDFQLRPQRPEHRENHPLSVKTREKRNKNKEKGTVERDRDFFRTRQEIVLKDYLSVLAPTLS